MDAAAGAAGRGGGVVVETRATQSVHVTLSAEEAKELFDAIYNLDTRSGQGIPPILNRLCGHIQPYVSDQQQPTPVGSCKHGTPLRYACEDCNE